MKLIDFIVNASEAWSGPYSNFSCRSRTLEGFKRCYDYVSGDTHYYDNGYDYKSYSNTGKTVSPTKTITKEYPTEYIRSYKKRMKRLRLWDSMTHYMTVIGTAGLVFCMIYMAIFFNITSFIIIGADIFVTIISFAIWSELIDKVYTESDVLLDVWLKQHPEFK